MMLNMRRLAYYQHDENETADMIEMTGIRFKSRFSMKVRRHRRSELTASDVYIRDTITVPESATMVEPERMGRTASWELKVYDFY